MALRQQKLNSQAESEEAEWNRRYKEAQLMADLGDYSGLQALGYNPTSLQQKASEENYNKIYNQVKNMWEDQNVDAPTIEKWLAQQNITDEEYNTILTSLGIETVLNNLDRLGKLSY